MTRILTDRQGRRWECYEGGRMGGAANVPPGGALPELTLAMLHCQCGELRLAFTAPLHWRELTDAELLRRLERKLAKREGGPA